MVDVTKAEDVELQAIDFNPWYDFKFAVRQLNPTGTGIQPITTGTVIAYARAANDIMRVYCPPVNVTGVGQWWFRIHEIDFVGFIGGNLVVQQMWCAPIGQDALDGGGIIAEKPYQQRMHFGTGNNRPHATLKFNPDVCSITDDVYATATAFMLTRVLCLYQMQLPGALAATNDNGWLAFSCSMRSRTAIVIAMMPTMDDYRDMQKIDLAKQEETLAKRVKKRVAEEEKINKIKKLKQLTMPTLDK